MTAARADSPWPWFGWSARAWARPWRAFARDFAHWHGERGLELGAGAQSALAPLMLGLVRQVECSALDAASLPAIEARHRARLAPQEAARVVHSVQDLRALRGRWDLIVMKSVLGGVHRLGRSSVADAQATLEQLVAAHLRPGGLLVTLDNGRTPLEPLWSRFGARRNGWRFFTRADFPPAEAVYGFGLLASFSAATRLGAPGRWIDDALYGADLLLSPWVRRHAVLLHVYRKPS
ncbi:MAG TPA: class I SAM-dependent methyltransferase [Ottowia sp.]|jgi:hypothetical protein|nr:class I SAM-dependent methyltransferase [Ottowia sp.]OJV59399.1 MAG: hypothetical protein BGO36_11615 [Burkholderiales bacterium 68-10]HMT82195.1 class I SAM-dependent methyltransferase [Ottowia sp.]HQX67727.1 class I SAM-dependent methyltransferase [Ottowia sp.]